MYQINGQSLIHNINKIVKEFLLKNYRNKLFL